MEKTGESSAKGVLVLATVKGDVHDIGKNLVDIICTNNGYEVHNLGIKIPITEMIQKVKEVKADALGMSGLLVKSTLIMRENLLEMNDTGVSDVPVILGGAALTRTFVEKDLREVYNGRVFYGRDAFEGLHTLDKLMAMVLSPSPELIRAHAALREEVMKCRQAIKPSEALGGVTTAMMAGVRSAPDDALPGLITAIEKLVDAKVIDGKEGDALRRFIAGEKSLRSDKKNAKTSTRQKLSSAIHAAKPVDIFVDAYNFMHTVHQHFQKLQMESKFNKGKFSFGPEARAHLAKLASRIYMLNEHSRVLLFIDGANCEQIAPYKGVKFVLPTIMRTGEGQADAEIIHYLAHKARKEALVVVVSNDVQVQTTANYHLSPGEFARFLEDLG
jgi:methylmalonyl-CoA mutase cobalamin-binding subunit